MNEFDATVGAEAPEGSKVIAHYDISDGYDVDKGDVYLLPDGRIYYRWASACSCWDGDYSSEAFPDLEEFFRMGLGQQSDRRSALVWENGFEMPLHLRAEYGAP